MLKSFKTEINPTLEQIIQINKTIGTCRFIYNFYLAHNKEVYEKEKRFVSANEFSVWMNNVFLPENPDKAWIKEVSTKAVKQSMVNAQNAYKRFFSGVSKFPKFKKKNVREPQMYFVKNSETECLSERHRIKIPTLGWVRLKEKGYLPLTKYGFVIKSGHIEKKAGRYYVSVLVDMPSSDIDVNSNEPLGVDLGLKDFAIVSNGMIFKNINKTKEVRKLEKVLKREQRSLSRMYENEKKGGATQRKNIQKQKLRLQKIYHRLDNIRTDYINKAISAMVKTKPLYIAIEDLNVQGMMKNKHLSKAIASQKFREFRDKLTAKCKEKGIELRIVDRFYGSSKTCHCCGVVKKDLKLSDRTYVCVECGYVEDRDFNASLNIRDTDRYELAF